MTPRPGVALIVLAKEPRPGRVKTRLCPPCTPSQAAALATAALIDTLAVAAATAAVRHVLALDGTPQAWIPAAFTVIPQCRGDLATRLAGAFDAVGAPALLIGMDTPQVTPALLNDAMLRLSRPATDAVLGLADDGGFWSIGLNDATAPVFASVPMSTHTTGRRQLDSLHRHGMRVSLLDSLRDVDDYDDAAAVAARIPHSRFAATFAAIDAQLVVT